MDFNKIFKKLEKYDVFGFFAAILLVLTGPLLLGLYGIFARFIGTERKIHEKINCFLEDLVSEE